ncbi:MAG: hypothetical protein PUK85_03830 [Clostridia bacterium]|nr:hypothetical protein [Clostridia bacterium]
MARPAAVFLLLTPFRCSPRQQLLVVLIRRGPKVLIPNGRTELREQDTLVMIET